MVADYVILGAILGVIGGFIATMYLYMIPKTSKVLRQKNADLEDLNKYNKKELRTLKNKLNASHALPKVSGDPDDIEGVISALLPKITDKFPEIKGLIGDQDVGAIIKLAKEHPDIVKKFLPKFISTGKSSTNDSSPDESYL